MTYQTKATFMGALIYFAIAGGVLVFWIYTVHSAGRELESRVALIAEGNAKVRMHNELSRIIDETEAERSALGNHVLTHAKTSSFLTEIESLGTSFGVELSTQSLKVVENDTIFDELTIEFTFEGSDQAARQMLRTFETLPYDSKVASVVVTRGEDGTVTGSVKIVLSLLAYDE